MRIKSFLSLSRGAIEQEDREGYKIDNTESGILLIHFTRIFPLYLKLRKPIILTFDKSNCIQPPFFLDQYEVCVILLRPIRDQWAFIFLTSAFHRLLRLHCPVPGLSCHHQLTPYAGQQRQRAEIRMSEKSETVKTACCGSVGSRNCAFILLNSGRVLVIAALHC